nr:protein kinase [Rhodopirellula sp. JC639]
MGIVFKARQAKLRRIVALKMILAGKLADADEVDRFCREAEAAGRLKHPNIVPVHEIGEHEGRHYFTMDFVEGRSLAEMIREETLAPRDAADMLRTIAEAVHFAHQQGTVHRDLKPANVLVAGEGTPHVTDFGLAKMLDAVDHDSRAELTATGQILGTPSYMSPEQASGKQELVGPASDIYSLGAILYACLTGRAPFVADSPVDTLLQVMRKEPVSPGELNPSVPKDLETICLKCLIKEPHKRYGTARELADDLSQFLEGRPVIARPVGRINKTIRWCRRNKAVATLLCLLFLSMAVGTYVSASYAVAAVRHANNEARQRASAEMAREEAEKQRQNAESAQLDAEKQRDLATKAKAQAEWSLSQEAEARRESETARKAEADARQAAEQSLANEETARREAEQRRLEALWQTYVARLQPMMYRFEQREYGQLESMLEQARPESPDEPDFRGWEWRYLNGLCRQQTSSVAEGAEFEQFFDWHPQTRRLAAFRNNELELWAGEPLKLQKRITTHPPGHVRFSPDGTHLAVAGKLTVNVFEIASGDASCTVDLAEHQGTNRNSNHITSIDWRSDGLALATGTNMGAIHLWNPADGNLIQAIELLPPDFPCNEMDWHPTDPVLAIATRYGYVFAIDTEQNKVDWRKKINRDYVMTARWNPSGTLVAGATSGGSDGSRLVIWNRGGEETMRSAGGAITGTPVVDWLNDEELLVATTDHDIHFFDHDQNVPTKTIRVHDGPVHRIVNHGDGQRVLSSSANEIRVTRVRGDVTLASAVRAHKFGIKAISWSPDSQRVATVSWDGIVSITNTHTGVLIHQLDGHANGAVNDVAWSPDGLRVASCDHSGEYRIWDADAGELLLKFKGGRDSGGFNSLAWIDDDQIAGCGTSLRIYEVNSGKVSRQIDGTFRHFASLAYCPSRQFIGHLASGHVAIFGRGGNAIYQTGVDADKGLAWSPDGMLLITGGETGIGVIECVNFKFLTTIKGHAGAVTDVCFSPDGSRLASSGRDGTVRIWDRATGAELLILEHADVRSFQCVDWSPDGSTIAAGANGLVVAWHAPVPENVHPPSWLATGSIASVKSRIDEIAELTEAINANRNDTKFIRKRADLYASQLMWKEALADFDRIAELRPKNNWDPVSAARVALMMGDREGYQRRIGPQVKRLLDQPPSSDTVVGDYVATTAALAPFADTDLTPLLPFSQSHVDANSRWWASRGMILLHLRSGHTSEVLALLDKHAGKTSDNYRIFQAAVRALANQQLGNANAAKEALATARTIANNVWFDAVDDMAIPYSNTGDFIDASVLLREAIEAVDVQRAPATEKDPPNATRPGGDGQVDGDLTAAETNRLIEKLQSNDSTQRLDALKAIQKLGPDASFAVPQLVKLLEQPDSYEKTQVIRCLGRVGPDEGAAMPQLLEIFQSEAPLTGSRFEAAQAIARMGEVGEVAIPTLIALVKDPGESVKSYLRKATAPSAQGLMAPLLRTDESGTYMDQRDMILLQVISSLAAFGTAASGAIPEIERVRDDPDPLPAIQQAAEKALARISG